MSWSLGPLFLAVVFSAGMALLSICMNKKSLLCCVAELQLHGLSKSMVVVHICLQCQ